MRKVRNKITMITSVLGTRRFPHMVLVALRVSKAYQ